MTFIVRSIKYAPEGTDDIVQVTFKKGNNLKYLKISNGVYRSIINSMTRTKQFKKK